MVMSYGDMLLWRQKEDPLSGQVVPNINHCGTGNGKLSSQAHSLGSGL